MEVVAAMIIPFDQALRRDGKAAPNPFSLDGLMAIMVTDLAGFTSRVSELGDLQARTWIREHNRLLRAALHKHAGHEVTHTGDGMIIAFRSVCGALGCAREIAGQLQLHSQSWPSAALHARIGVHAGEPLPDEGRLFGCSINTAVRVCGQARAGQVLVTDVIRQLAQGSGFSFQPLGDRPLKGLAQTHSLFELCADAC